MDVSYALQEYSTSQKRKLAPTTLKDYTQKLTVFGAWCIEQHISLEGVNGRAVNKFLDHLSSTHVPHKSGQASITKHTLSGYVRVIRAFLHWCLEDEEFSSYVKREVIERIKPPKLDERIIETFTVEQVRDMLRAVEKEGDQHLKLRDRAILRLLIDTGIRNTELVELRLDHVFLSVDEPYIRVFGKGQKEREVGPLSHETARALRRYINMHRVDAPKSSTVFINRYHQPLTVYGLDQLIERIGERAGVEGVRCSPHTFRHTYAVMYMRNGGDIYKLSKLLGHTSLRVTEDYLKTFKQSDARRGSTSILDLLK